MTSDRIGLVIHGPDGDALARLRSSVERFNVESLPTTLALGPPGILDLWSTTDLDIVVSVSTAVEFIRPFGVRDFVHAPGVPFTVVSEEAERRVEAVDPGLDAARREVLREVGIADPRLLVSRGLAVVSTAVLRSFATDFLAGRGWQQRDALAICDDEYAWYVAWLRASGVVPFEMREPLVAALDTPGAQSALAMNGASAQDLARAYVGVLWPDSPADDQPRDAMGAIAASASAGELASATVRRVTRKAPRVQRWLHLH